MLDLADKGAYKRPIPKNKNIWVDRMPNFFPYVLSKREEIDEIKKICITE